MKPFFVYILACGDGSYYTGHTDDLTVRLRQHEDGGIGYTATRKPFSLKWQGEFETRAAALAFEQQIKGWSRAKKEALMAGDWEQVMTLARGLRQAPLGRGEAQPERGEAPLERGGAPLERGEAPLERGEAPPERGGVQAGSQPSVHPEPFDVAQDRLVEGPAHARLRQAQPERSGVQPERSGVQPERSGVQPERSGVRPERSGVRPEQSGVRPELSGVRPERSGVRPEQSGVRSEQSGVQPERSGVRPERSGVRPERSGVRPEQSGVRPEQSGVRPELSGVRPEQSGVRSERSGVRPERSGVRPERSGVRPERSEVEPERSGVRPDRSASQTAPQPSVRPEPVEGPAPTAPATEVSPLAIQVLAGHRRAIAKAITLLESTRADHRAQADDLLTALLPHTGKAFRVGISGVPGVGKSTFIEALGLHLIGQGHRVAVLTIDPSSSVSGGSILGDKTRMERLSVDDRAFIRPSPSSGTLGGVAEKTREAMLVCEAAGFDIVIVETVGVGQSETAVANMTDLFVLMQLPNAGDDLQAIKKGVMELADLVVINKADLDPDAATRAQAQITSALRLFTQHGRESSAAPQPVLQLSALRADGVQAFWQAACAWRESRTRSGRLQARRQHQALAWMWERVEASLRHEFRQHPAVQAMLPAITLDVEGGRLAASTAARRLLQARQNDQ